MQKVIKIILIILLIINILYVFGGVVYHPLQSMDSIGIWFFKAKAFYVEHGFPYHFLHAPQYSYSHQQYPLGIPFLFFIFYSLIGGINEKLALLFYPLVYVIILILAYKVMRRTTTSIPALIFTYIYSMFSPLIASGGRILAGNADIFLVLIEWLILFIFYKKKLAYKSYLLIAVLIMVASQIKLEGVFLALILFFLPLPKKEKIIFFFSSIIPFLAWLLTVYMLKIPSDNHMIILNSGMFIERLIEITTGMFREFLNINNWYIFWPLFFVVLFKKQKVSKQIVHVLYPTVLVIMSMYIVVYMLSSNDTSPYVASSFDRVLLQQSPIIFLIFFEKMNVIILSKINLFVKNPFRSSNKIRQNDKKILKRSVNPKGF